MGFILRHYKRRLSPRISVRGKASLASSRIELEHLDLRSGERVLQCHDDSKWKNQLTAGGENVFSSIFYPRIKYSLLHWEIERTVGCWVFLFVLF